MKKKLFFGVLCVCCIQMAVAQTKYAVTLQVVDYGKGSYTNKENDNNETNVFCWISDNLKAQNTRTPDDWWYPMYHNSGIEPDGLLLKTDTAWIWQTSLLATTGNYEWNPYMKTLGWKTINKNVVYWGENDNLSFTVANNGIISGITQINIGRTFDVTLTLRDRSKGTYTQGSDENIDKNIAFESKKNANNKNMLYERLISASGDWWWAMYAGESRCPNSALIKNDSVWDWTSTISLPTGQYCWIPKFKSWADVYDSYSYGDSKILTFQIDINGNISGEILAAIGVSSPTTNIAETGYAVHISVLPDEIVVSGAQKSIELYNTAGIRLIQTPAQKTTSLQTSQLPQGLYLLAVDGKAQKIRK